jgi:hypothetical protein
MPNITKGAVKRRGVKLVTAGKKGGFVVQRFAHNAGSEARFKDAFANRQNRLVPPRVALPRQEPHNMPAGEIPDQRDLDFGDNVDQHMDQHMDQQFTIDPPDRIQRALNKASKRKSYAENWVSAERRIVDVAVMGEIPACSCRTRERIFVRHISCEGAYHRVWPTLLMRLDYEIRPIEYCPCGRTSALLFRDGWFQSTPVKPRTVFSCRLLRVLSSQSVRGSISRTAWAEGLRAAHEYYLQKVVPGFDQLLRDAYSHWVAVEHAIETRISAALHAADPQIWEEEKLVNMCPACFDFEEYPADRSAGISTDGNLQHYRYDKQAFDFERLTPKLFVNYKGRDYNLANEVPDVAAEVEGSRAHQFKATNGWNKTESTLVSKKKVDESGLMVLTCFHGMALRFVNMYRTGERQTHALTLLKSLLAEKPDIDKLRLCYDVACVFGPALQHLLPPEESAKITAAIGRFHIYAHQFGCHINYNTLRKEGFGLMIGEEPEFIWAQLAHMVSNNRVSTGARRTQNIDCAAFYIAKRTRETFGQNLQNRLDKAQEMEVKERGVLDDALSRTTHPRVDQGGMRHAARSVRNVD